MPEKHDRRLGGRRLLMRAYSKEVIRRKPLETRPNGPLPEGKRGVQGRSLNPGSLVSRKF